APVCRQKAAGACKRPCHKTHWPSCLPKHAAKPASAPSAHSPARAASKQIPAPERARPRLCAVQAFKPLKPLEPFKETLMPTYHIELFEGRSVEEKRKLVEAVTRVTTEVLGSSPESVDIV